MVDEYRALDQETLPQSHHGGAQSGSRSQYDSDDSAIAGQSIISIRAPGGAPGTGRVVESPEQLQEDLDAADAPTDTGEEGSLRLCLRVYSGFLRAAFMQIW